MNALYKSSGNVAHFAFWQIFCISFLLVPAKTRTRPRKSIPVFIIKIIQQHSDQFLTVAYMHITIPCFRSTKPLYRSLALNHSSYYISHQNVVLIAFKGNHCSTGSPTLISCSTVCSFPVPHPPILGTNYNTPECVTFLMVMN